MNELIKRKYRVCGEIREDGIMVSIRRGKICYYENNLSFDSAENFLKNTLSDLSTSYSLSESTVLKEHKLIDEINTYETFKTGEKIVVNGIDCQVREIVYNMDSNCWDIRTDYLFEIIKVDDNIKNKFWNNEKEFRDLRHKQYQKLMEAEINETNKWADEKLNNKPIKAKESLFKKIINKLKCVKNI